MLPERRATVLRFDDLLAARLVAQQLPAEGERLATHLADLGAGRSTRSVLFTLVSAATLTMDQARGVQEMVERWKRGRALGLYAQLLQREGVALPRLQEVGRRLGPNVDLDRLGELLAREGVVPQQAELRLRYQARLALDRDLARQAEEWVALRRRDHPTARLGAPVGEPSRGAISPPSGVFRFEIPQPTANEAAEILDTTLTRIDAETPPPGFPIPAWIDSAAQRVGQRIGRFRILGLIGEGGNGIVWLGQADDEPGRPVAVKVLRLDAKPAAVGRFKREVLANSLFSHPSALEVIDAGQTEKGEHFLAMEFFDGKNLAEIIEAEKRLAPRQALPLAQQVLGALGAAHGQGMIHRDVKPENILVSRDRTQAKLMDFGLALLESMGDFKDKVFQTVGPDVVGTPRYMSPEQCAGETLKATSDLYSMGLVLYEMLAGRFPYESDSAVGFMACHITEDAIPFAKADPACAKLPAELIKLIDRLLDKDVDLRPQSAAEVVGVIEQALRKL
jgi:predicted Ser/Thr protein kinase